MPSFSVYETEEDVLGADEAVTEAQRLAQRELQHLRGARGEGDLPRGDLFAGSNYLYHLGPHTLHGDVERPEDPRAQPLLFAQQPKQNVLGTQVVVAQGASLFLRQDDHQSGSLRETLEHVA